MLLQQNLWQRVCLTCERPLVMKNKRDGYKIGNIQLVCHAANMIKQDFGMEELKQWCQKILEVSHSIRQS